MAAHSRHPCCGGSAVQAALVFVVAFGSIGCASPTIRRFPLREPMWVDTDLRSVSIACRASPEKDDPNHQSCAPRPYVSTFGWDAADNTVFRPLSHFFKVSPGGEAVNVNSLDETPDSSWFVNRIGRVAMSPEQAAVGPCQVDLDPEGADGSWVIDKGKTDGATPGFRVKVPGKGKFMLKADFSNQPERPSAASAIGVRLYYAAGFHVACDSVVNVRPSLLKLSPGLTVTDNSGKTRPFDQKALEAVLAASPLRGERRRMQSSQWLPGLPIGPFRYEGVRDDDPNDVIAHEDRRELRGARVLAAWINHFDAREQNSMSSWIADNPAVADSSPGHVRHYYLDVSDSMGSEWDWDGISRRLGHSYYLDFEHVGQDFVTFGLLERPWEKAKKAPEGEIFGYFKGDDFEPDQWKAGYPNPTFSRMSERDGAWMTRIIARLTPEHVRAIVKTGQFSQEKHEKFLLDALLERRRRILRRYFSILSPVTDVEITADGICALDLASWSGVFSDRTFNYSAHLVHDGSRQAEAPGAVVVKGEGRVCIPFKSVLSTASSIPAGDPQRYRVIELSNGQSKSPLWIHLYDTGADRGLVLAGLERPSP